MAGVGGVKEGWEVVIGLEVHAQLRTRSKLFSSAPVGFGGEPNTRTTEVDLGMPGVLPVVNREAVELALRAALALGCDVHLVSIFARKHYFYPDLPKGYQISQYEEPFCTGGGVPVELEGNTRTVPLTRIHMEEDAGKLIHDDAITSGESHLDLNRAGVPLIEIVSEPEIRSPAEAAAYLRSLRSILRYLDVSDADMEKGNLRCDGNVSVRRIGDPDFGTKVELKNLNSFRFLERGLAYEIDRQIELLEEGGEVVQETRRWDDRRDRTRPSRSKEDADDYRYFPDPDLAPLRIDPAWLDEIRATLPELPHRRCARFREELGLPEEDARILTEDRAIADFFEAVVALYDEPKTVSNWVLRSLLEAVSGRPGGLADLALTPAHMAELLRLVDDGKLTPASARQVFAEMADTGERPTAIMSERGLEAVSDAGELEAMARAALEASPDNVEKYRAGEKKVLNYFIGQVMKQTRGKADPATVREVFGRLLDG